MIPVSTPTGSSFPLSSTRQQTSTQIKKIAPISAERGTTFLWSVPTIIRTQWGITNPTKPTIPAAYTNTPTIAAQTTKYTWRHTCKLVPVSYTHLDVYKRQLLLLGLIFGIVGGLFAWCLKLVKRFLSDKIKNPIIRIALVGVGLSALFLLLYQGRYSGLGTNLIQASFNNGTIYGWDWILKFILTIVTLSAGFQGGEVTPLFSIGASLGAAMAGLFLSLIHI